MLRLLERLKTWQEQRLVRKLDLRILKVFEKPEVSAFLEVINYKSLFGAFGGFFVLFISLITSPSKKTIFFDRTNFIINPTTTIASPRQGARMVSQDPEPHPESTLVWVPAWQVEPFCTDLVPVSSSTLVQAQLSPFLGWVACAFL